MNTAAEVKKQSKPTWRTRMSELELRRAVVYLAFFAILLFFSIMLRDQGFLTTSNLLNIVRQTAPITVMAVGMTFTLSAGEIDLSIGSIVALSALVAAVVLRDVGFVPGVVAGMSVGLVVGLVNGLLTVKVRIPSFLVTLGMLGIVAGLARTLTDLQSVPVRNDLFITIFGGGSLGPVSTLVLWTIIAAIIGHLILQNLRFGRHVLATGGERQAANYVGINTGRIRIAVLVMSATTASLAGLLYTGRLAGARYTLGEADLLTVIAAVIIGGTSLFGGRGTIIGSLVGSIIMGMLNNGLILMGLEVAEQMIARGVIIILAVALSLREPKNT